MEFDKSEYGAIKIHNEVIIAVVRRAAMEIDGVERIASGFKKGLRLFLRRRKFSRGVIVDKTKDGDIKITVSLVVLFGVNIPDLVNKVQANVKKMLEQMTGIMPVEIDVEVEKVVREKEMENTIEEIEAVQNKEGE